MSNRKQKGTAGTAQNKDIPWSINFQGSLHWFEKIALLVEQPFNRLAGSLKLNIFYHTDSIAAFLWLIVAITGLYVTFFYQFGYDGSYDAVAKIESQFVARTIRAIHRYASGSAVIITLLHAYRTFFMDRFRGARWLAWVSGIGMMLILWLDAVTGYWLIWDQRAQVITDTFISFFNRYFGTLGDKLGLSLLVANRTDGSWAVMFWILTVHIALFTAVGLFFWFHIMRLNKPKYFPPQRWMVSTAIVIIVASALFPVGMLPRASFDFLPKQIELDPFFLFYFPAELGGTSANLFWTTALIIVLVLTAFPWVIHRRKPAPVKVIDEACIGCTLCAVDCPYKALEMVERKEGEKGSKLVAIAHPEMCVSCGICIGSCAYDAIEVGELNAKAMWEATSLLLTRSKENAPNEQVKVVFMCERHAAHGAHPFLETEASPQESEARLITIPLPCVGAVPPDLVGNTYKAGASEVQLIGCPPDDCTQRRGNTWAEERLTRVRKPLLRSVFKDAPISFNWQPPDSFKRGLAHEKDDKALTWKNYAPVYLILIGLLIVQILFTNLPFNVYSEPQVKVQLVSEDIGKALGSQVGRLPANAEVDVILYVNEEVYIQKTYQASELASKDAPILFEEISLPPGKYSLIVKATTENAIPKMWILATRDVNLEDRDIYSITLVAPGLSY